MDVNNNNDNNNNNNRNNNSNNNSNENITTNSVYDKLGVSHQKEDVDLAIGKIDKGLFPSAFCKVIPDISGDPLFGAIVHADGAGTKSTLAYMQYKETGDLDYFKGIVQDSVVMNLDDVLCAGATGPFILSNTLGRNKKIISGQIVGTIIQAYEDFTKKLRDLNIPISTCGGETADVGDLVRTLIVDSTLVSRIKREKVILPERIKNGDVIVGLSSFGQATYEEKYNSGIGSNGLTLARHGLLHHDYFKKYPECFSPELPENLVFFGKYHLNDPLPETSITIGDAILSPTRTYAPILWPLLNEYNEEIHMIFHNTGGGQSKCLKFGNGLHYIKNNLFPTPPLFKIIQDSSNTPWSEMYQVFNMGHRMEIIVEEDFAKEKIIPISKKFNIDAKIIGHIEKNNISNTNQLTISSEYGTFNYSR